MAYSETINIHNKNSHNYMNSMKYDILLLQGHTYCSVL